MILSTFETMPREKIKEFQFKRLKGQVINAYTFSPFYRKRFDAAGIKPEDINSLDDLGKIPIITAEILRREVKETGDPFANMLCVPEERVISSNVYKEIDFDLPAFFSCRTQRDYNLTVQLLVRLLLSTGVRFDDTFQSFPTCQDWYDDLVQSITDWMGMTPLTFDAGKALDAGRGFLAARRFRPDISFVPVKTALNLIATAKEMNIDPKEVFSCYRINIFIDGLLTPEVSKELREGGFSGEFYNLVHIPEAAFYAIDCEQHSALHVAEDFSTIEATEPETGKPLPPGGKGRLTVTNLRMQATPYIRYQSEDLVTINEERCPCGRTTLRITYHQK